MDEDSLNKRTTAKKEGHYELSKSLPDVSMTGEVSTLKLAIAQLEREQIDLLRLILHLRGRLKQVSKENVELVSKVLEASAAVETAKRQLAIADAARDRAVEEMESLKIRFSDALRDHELQQREALCNTLNQSDTRLEVIRASLLLAEKKAAEASARAFHADSQLADLTKRFQAMEIENKCLREENTKLTEELKKSLATANMQSEKVLKKLTHFQEQANLDEDAMRDSISLLRLQLREALERAEKSQTELILANEAQVRLLSRSNALEQRLQHIESDLAFANQCHEAELREVRETAKTQETQLKSALEQLTRLYEAKMGHAEDLFNRQNRLLKKLREECRSNVEAFDLMVSQTDRRQQTLLTEAQTVSEIAAVNREECDRLYSETVDHLTQANCLARQVAQLEMTLSDKNCEIKRLNGDHQKLVKDARVLSKEVKYLQNQLSQCISEKENILFDRCISGSYEVQEVIARVEKLLPE
ncbi:Laminin subunit beta-1 [Taenia solium]|eukprot:TsM_000743800 transcript=TsM_000743800 gene=TsM_000743800